MKFAEITCIRRSVNGLFSEKRFLSDWAVWRSLRIVLNDGPWMCRAAAVILGPSLKSDNFGF